MPRHFPARIARHLGAYAIDRCTHNIGTNNILNTRNQRTMPQRLQNPRPVKPTRPDRHQHLVHGLRVVSVKPGQSRLKWLLGKIAIQLTFGNQLIALLLNRARQPILQKLQIIRRINGFLNDITQLFELSNFLCCETHNMSFPITSRLFPARQSMAAP